MFKAYEQFCFPNAFYCVIIACNLLFSKENEGSVYKDGTNATKGRGVMPNQTYTYHWFVPKRASPGKSDAKCITWAYYSDVDPVKDTNSGLVGPLITCQKVCISV